MSEAGSGIEGMLNSSSFARYVAQQLTEERFKLIDVGCAGGIAPGWRMFGDRLSALAFDADADEIDRLNAVETNARVRHVAGYVGMPDNHPLKQRIGGKSFWHQWPSGRLSYERTQDIRASRREGRDPRSLDAYLRDRVLGEDWPTRPKDGFDLDYEQAFHRFAVDEGEASRALADHDPRAVIHLPPYVQAAGFRDADFLKLDIDGPDYEVLRSVSEILAQPSLLGVSLEVCFYGSHDANDNSFHNMDRLMREKGFDLFGLSVRTYASAALPFPYMDVHPSNTSGGRPVQGDAIYIRDLASRARSADAASVSAEKLAKIAALLALFTLPDHAAEVLLVHRQRLSALLDIDHGLELLTAEIQLKAGEPLMHTYKDYIHGFETEDIRFLDRYGARNAWMDGVIRDARQWRLQEDNGNPLAADLAKARRWAQAAEAEAEALRSRLQTAEAKASAAEAAHLQASRLQSALRNIETSRTWRLTYPFRFVISRLTRRG